jgi:hypothetical protein
MSRVFTPLEKDAGIILMGGKAQKARLPIWVSKESL